MNFNDYEDILEPRRKEFSHFIWSSKKIDTTLAHIQKIKLTPFNHKQAVLYDSKIQQFLDIVSLEKGIPKDDLEQQVCSILNEIGYNKNLKVIRILAVVLVKICLKVCRGIYVQKDRISYIKSLMGNCPVIFVPSHRSYADFILMSFLCFTYDVEIPAIAAGMDFHGMWGMASILRDTGAFFMRRSYNNDSLYWITFKQYINQLITKGELPIEFFIEGTRSRSNKSLPPKYGLLNMTLKPLFLRQVSDVMFVPINISYERVLEEKLFSFELLGVPKPKESTSAFFKSLSIIQEKYGSIHMNFGKPISSKEYFGEYLDKSRHSIGPINQQELNEYDKRIFPSIAHEIINAQQKLTTLNIVNLIALLINFNLINRKDKLNLKELEKQIEWIKPILELFGANIWCINTIKKEIEEALLVHKNMFRLTKDGKLDISRTKINLNNINVTKLKAYCFSETNLTNFVPFVMLYIYINPILHYIVDHALILTVLSKNNNISLDSLFNQYHYLRKLLAFEFVTFIPKISSEFNKSLNMCLNLQLVKVSEDGKYNLLENNELNNIFISVIQPFLYSYMTIVQILETYEECDEKNIFIEAQKRIVNQDKFIHPYSLNLDSFSHCLNALITFDALKKINRQPGSLYKVDKKHITSVKKKIEPYASTIQTESMGNIFLTHKL